MPIVITEIAFTAEGYLTVEIYNNGAVTETIGSASIFLGRDGNAAGERFSNVGLTEILPGEVITLGHSSVAGVDFNFAPGLNDAFTLAIDDNHVFILTSNFSTYLDVIGGGGGTSFVADSSYQTDTSRMPVSGSFPDAGSDASTFVFSQPFSTNSLGTVVCFGAGTLISVPGGVVPVETLAIGDPVSTEDGRTTPVLWIGRQTLTRRTHRERPPMVRIAAGALGDCVPYSDLSVTADHGMIVDGYVVNASALVNGTSIDWVPMSDLPASFTVYHIETEAHDIILANGAASESFIDVAGRAAFDNYAEYLDLYRTERIIPEMRTHRITTPRLLPERVRRRLGGALAGRVSLASA